VTVQVLDTTATAEMNLSTGSPIPWIYEHTFPGPTRYNAQLTPVFTLNPPIHDTENLFVVMKALNGDFWEQILLHRSNGTWHEAILVTAFYRATIGEHVTKRAGVVLEEIDPNIPSEILRSNGWDAKKWPHPIIPKP
jgi:hypothetical protein